MFNLLSLNIRFCSSNIEFGRAVNHLLLVKAFYTLGEFREESFNQKNDFTLALQSLL